MTLTVSPFAGVAVTEIVSAAAQTEILAQIDLIIALIPDGADGSSPAATKPDFDAVRPEYATNMIAELEALKTAIDAAPTA